MHKLIETIEYLIEKHPEEIVEFAKHVYKEYPELFDKMLSRSISNDWHITNKNKYEELISHLKWANNTGKGAKWSFEDIVKNSKINFYNVDFTEYDYAFLVNMLYAKCCKEYTDPAMFLKLAKCLLEDTDEETKLYYGAYIPKHLDYEESNHHYDEEARRRKMRYDDEYSEEEKKYYKTTKIGFNS